MVSGTFSRPCGRPSVSAVSRVNVSECSGSPVTARSLSAQSTGGAVATAASATARARGSAPRATYSQ